MIDIIVLPNDNIKDIKQTLFSIAYQENSESVNVYIMNNKKTKNYKDLVKYFSNFIKIREVECFDVKNSYEVKQYGIDHTKSEYLMFIDAGSMLEGNLALNNITRSLNNIKPDIIASKTKVHLNGCNVQTNNENNSIYGKLYKREFLIKNNIRFIKNIVTEDTAFNKICCLMTGDILECAFDFYLKVKELDFDYYNDYSSIKKYVQNMYYYACEEEKSNKIDVGHLAYSILAYIYSQYLQISEKDYNDLLKYADKFKKLYLKNPLNKQERIKILKKEYKATEELDERIWSKKEEIHHNMVDIIMPAYNAHDMILKTLMSIALQNYKSNIHVYIVDDCSKTSYEKEVELFKNEFKITLMKLEKNSGPGAARQYALERTNGDFVLFLDSDDLLYEYNVISRLVNQIGDNNIAQGFVLDENKNGTYSIYNDSKWDLHGKLYRRSLIDKYNIKFINSRKSEDDAFHKLCFIASDKVTFVDDLVYFYRNNSLSIVNSVDDYWFNSLDDYIKNMTILFEMCEERKLNIKRISKNIIEVFLFTYEVYMKYMNRKDVKKILVNIPKLYEFYTKYKDVYTPKEQKKIYDDYIKDRKTTIPLKDYISVVKKI